MFQPVVTARRGLVLLTLSALPLWSSNASVWPSTGRVAPLQAGADPLAPSAATAWPLGIRLQSRATTFGTYIGAAGLFAVDLQGDRVPEIVASAFAEGNTHFWYVLEPHRRRGYRQTFVSAPFQEGISSMAVAALDGDADPEIVVATGGRVHVYDGGTKTLQWTVPTTATEIRTLKVVDVDSDGAQEMVFCGPNGLYIYDAMTGTAEVQGMLGNCDALDVGNVDGDAGLEIVLGYVAGLGYVLDGATRATEWTLAPGFGLFPQVGDVDGDGIDEIIGAFNERVSVFDAVSRLEEAFHLGLLWVGPIALADVEGDGALEILWGERYGGRVHVLDGVTLVQKWVVGSAPGNVTGILVADMDDDGVRELAWGGGYSPHTPDLSIADSRTLVTEWESLDFSGPFYGLAHGDVEGNGRPDYLYAAIKSDNGYDAGLYFVRGAIGNALRYVSPRMGIGFGDLVRVQLVNVDDDPQLEVLVGVDMYFSGVLVCYDGLTHVEQWRVPVADALSIWSVQLADVDADGELEAVIGTRRRHTGIAGTYVYVVDAASGALEWQSHLLPGWHTLSLLRVTQLDDDAPLEILVASYRSCLYLLDSETRSFSILVNGEVTALETHAPPGTARADVFVGTRRGDLYRLRYGRGWRQRVIGRYGADINGLAVRDLNGDGTSDYTFAVNDRISIVDGATKATLWRSGWIGTDVGAHDSLMVADVDRDGRQEIVVNIGRMGVDTYEVPGS